MASLYATIKNCCLLRYFWQLSMCTLTITFLKNVRYWVYRLYYAKLYDATRLYVCTTIKLLSQYIVLRIHQQVT